MRGILGLEFLCVYICSSSGSNWKKNRSSSRFTEGDLKGSWPEYSAKLYLYSCILSTVASCAATAVVATSHTVSETTEDSFYQSGCNKLIIGISKLVWLYLYHVQVMWQRSEETQRPTPFTRCPSNPLHQPTFSWSMQNPSHTVIDHSIAVSPKALGQTLFSHSPTKLRIWAVSFHVSPYQSHRSKGWLPQ